MTPKTLLSALLPVPSLRGHRRRVALSIACLASMLVPSTQPGLAAAEDVPGLKRTTVIAASDSRSAIVVVPITLDASRGDLPTSSLGGDEVVANPSENFVGLVLSSVEQTSDTASSDLPRLVAIQLQLPDGPRIAFSLQGWQDSSPALRLPAGEYRLSVLATGPVDVQLTLPGLPEGSATITPSQPASYTLDYSLQDPTPGGIHWPSFTAGFQHTAARDHQMFMYLWAVGDLKGVDQTVFCSEYGETVSAAGVYLPHCGFGGSGSGFVAIGVQQPHVTHWWSWGPVSEPRSYSVGGYWSVGGTAEGGGVLYLWLDQE